MKLPWLLLCVAVLTVPSVADDIVFGGVTVFETGLAFRSGSLSTRAGLAFTPELAVYGATTEFRASGSISLRHPGPGLALDLTRLQLRLYPVDRLGIDLGYLTRTSGSGLLVSPVNFMAPLEFGLAADGLPSVAGPELMLGATAFLGPAFVAAHLAPSPLGFQTPEVNASTLDSLGLFSSTDDSDLGAGFARSSLRFADTVRLTDPSRRISFLSEVGLPFGPLDLSFLYYRGIDRIPTVGLHAATGPDNTFDLTITPVESQVNALGLALASALGPVSLWLDGSYVFDRRFGTTDFTATAVAGEFENTGVTAAAAEIVAGMLVSPATPV